MPGDAQLCFSSQRFPVTLSNIDTEDSGEQAIQRPRKEAYQYVSRSDTDPLHHDAVT